MAVAELYSDMIESGRQKKYGTVHQKIQSYLNFYGKLGENFKQIQCSFKHSLIIALYTNNTTTGEKNTHMNNANYKIIISVGCPLWNRMP